MTDKVAAKKRDSMRNNLILAYEAYRRGEPRSMDNLLSLVRAFALMKVYHLEYEFKDFGTAETADDWAQEVTIKVWQGLEKFDNDPKSTPVSFYSWVHKIAFNRASEAFNYLLEEKSRKVSLFVKTGEGEGDDHDGEDESVENPLIHEQSDNGFSIRIPASVQGIDLLICKMLLTEVRGEDDKYRGRNYAQVGELLGMTEDAVAQRLNRLRKRLKIEREQKQGRTTNSEAAD